MKVARLLVATAAGLCGAAMLAVLVTAGSPAAAQTPPGFEHIDAYDVAIEIESSGDLRVHEKIDYDFGPHERHGIFRTIPYRFRYDDRYDRVMPVDDIRVSSPSGAPADVKVEREGGQVRMRIGDPDVEIRGRHTYVISYRVRGALNAFAEHDELYWNAVGVEWPVAVDDVDVTVEAPARIRQVACFRGPDGSNFPCAAAAHRRRQAAFRDGRLFPFEGVTVVVAIPKNVVVPEPAPILDERWTIGRAFTADAAHLGLAGAAAALGIAGVVTVAWRHGRDRELIGTASDIAFAAAPGEAVVEERVGLMRRIEVPVEYVPPDGVRPGLVGTLVDEVAHPLDVSATIVDLAVRGFLRIEEIRKPGIFRRGDWRLERLAADREDTLLEYERHLLAGLFKGGDSVEISDLRNEFATRMKGVQGKLYDEVVRRGWFVRRPDKVREFWTAVSVGALVLAIGATVALAALTTFGWVGIALVLVALVFVSTARRMPHRTAAGRAALRRILGFRRFIEESGEPERARFAERADLFTEYLPYAMVFGATERWARAFGDLAEQADTSWYVSDRPFNPRMFTDSVNGFAVTTSGVLTSTPAGSGASGFSSGGGSSGGGGGGGGGGSW
jgi:hypothetical protein